MELAVTVLKWIIGPVIGAVITVLLTEPLRERLIPLLAAIGTMSLIPQFNLRHYPQAPVLAGFRSLVAKFEFEASDTTV